MGKDWRDLPRPWIADIGSGGDPWPLANILVDKFQDDATVHRSTHLHTDGKLMLEADVCDLPFEDNELDWVRCSHVVEHTEDPSRALAELQRVCKRGEVWVPTIQAEACWRILTPNCRPSGHLWLCSRVSYHLVAFFQFFDYDAEFATNAIKRLAPIDDSSRFGYGTEVRIAWGWGSWPERVDVQLYGFHGETLEEFKDLVARIEKGAVTA